MKIFFELLTLFGFYIGFSFLFVESVFAKIDIPEFPSKIEINKEFEISVDLDNLTDPTHYLSIALHKKAGDPYFGLTKFGDNWIEADDDNCKSFPLINPNEGSWSGKLVGRLNYGEEDYDNSLGGYILKVIKYTDSCNKSYSNDLSVELFDSNPPPPSLTPTLIPSDTPKPTATPKPPTATKVWVTTKSSSSILTINPTNPPLQREDPKIIAQETKFSDPRVLGAEISSKSARFTDTPSPRLTIMPLNEHGGLDNIAKILIAIGGIFILISGVWMGIIKKRQKN